MSDVVVMSDEDHLDDLFEFSEEHDQFRKALRGFAETASPTARVRELMERTDAVDRDLWRRLAVEVGVPGLVVPERFGGAGGDQVDLAIAAEELGRGLLCVPLLSSTVLATNLLLAVDDERAHSAYVAALVEAEQVATVLTPPADLAEPVGSADFADGTWSVSAAGLAVDGAVADLILLGAVTPDGPALMAVEAGAPGVNRIELDSLDRTRRYAHIDLRNAPARMIGRPGDATAALATMRDLAATALAAESLGVAQRCLDDVVTYVGQRVQFGRIIGGFQAVKHTCADLHTEVEMARSAAYAAAWEARRPGPAHTTAANVARAWCGDVAVHVATEAIQLYGGIGFTWEHDAHLFLRRAKSNQLMLGGTAAHRGALAAELSHEPARRSA